MEGEGMKASQIRWWMAALQKAVYINLAVGGMGFVIFGLTMMLKNLEYKAFFAIFGLALGFIGVVACFLSGVAYDKLNAKLRIAETAERKEKQKEEKISRKTKV
jgi:hypothetical protein